MVPSAMPKPSSREFWTVIIFTYGVHILLSIASRLVYGFQPHILITNGSLLILLAEEVSTAALLSWYLFGRGWRLSDLSFSVSGGQTLEGAGLYVLSLFACWLVGACLLQISLVQELVQSVYIERHVSIYVAIAITLVNPAFEEILNLGYVQQCLDHHGPAFSIGVAVLLRLLMHIYQGPIAVLTILPIGIAFSWYFRWRRRLYPVILAHAIMDFIGLCSHR